MFLMWSSYEALMPRQCVSLLFNCQLAVCMEKKRSAQTGRKA